MTNKTFFSILRTLCNFPKLPSLSQGQFIQNNERPKWKERQMLGASWEPSMNRALLRYCSVTMMPPESRKCSLVGHFPPDADHEKEATSESDIIPAIEGGI